MISIGGPTAKRPSWARETIAIGTATDPYQPIEGHYKLTRQAIELCAAARTPISIVTKGPMVVRDIDVLRQVAASARCSVFVSVPSADDAAWRTLEPGTAPPAKRLRAVRELRDAGLHAAVLMMPLVPGITTSRSSIERTLRAIAEAGVPLAGAGVARLDPGVKEYFLEFLGREYPQLSEGYLRLFAGANAPSSYTREVQAVVRAFSSRLGVARLARDV